MCIDSSENESDVSIHDLGISKNGMIIGHINIQGIRSKFDELQILLTSNKIDIFGITETKLDQIHITESFTINGFQVPFRKDRSNKKGGGILVYVRNNISCCQRTDLEDSELEHVWLEVKNPNSKSFLLCVLYRPPSSLVSWKTSFDANIDKAQCEDKEILIVGDLNKDLMNDQLKEEWVNFTLSLGLTQLITTPTRVSKNSKTLIDHIYSDNIQNISWTTAPKLSLSDHFPIFCSRKTKINCKKSAHHSIKYRSFKSFNENDFLSDLNSVGFDNIMQMSDVNVALNTFIENFISLIDKHVPLRQHRVKKIQQPDWINGEILDAMKERDKFKIRHDENNYKLYRNKVSELISQAKKNSYEKKIAEGQNNPSSIWKIFKEFRTPGQVINPINTITVDGQDVSDPQIISNEFNTFFTNIASKLKEHVPFSEFANTKQFINDRVPDPMFFNIPYISIDMVNKMLSSLDISKSTGLDEIGPRFLKLSAASIYPVIHHILNLSISQSIFPDVWKSAKVNPLFKSGSKHDVNNYRPISVLPTLSKLLEKHVHDSIMTYLNHYKLIAQAQSGFRKNHSCETALVHIIDKWLQAINDGCIVGVVLVDFKKAFDLVDHNILLQKLTLYKCSKRTLNWFKSYLFDRKQSVNLNGVMSSERNITCGVPQGSILGPLLFLLFINDLPLYISDDISYTDMYADDTTIHNIHRSIDTVQRNLQTCLNNLENWCKLNGMILNTDKTKALLITTPHKRARLTNNSLSLTFKNVFLKSSKGEKLLGVNINENLTWNDHINRIRKKLSTNLWLLSRLKWFIPLSARILFYNAYIQPHLDFCNIVWGGSNITSIHPLFIVQKRACKLIFGHEYVSVSESLEKINCLSVSDKVILQKAKFMFKVSRGLVPTYISHMFNTELKTNTSLRSTNANNFYRPRPNLEIFKQSISYSGPSIWNSIPKSIQNMNTIECFTSHFIRWLKSHN